MKRLLLLTLCLTVGIALTGMSQGLAVPPNENPAPGLLPSSWACYPTCVLPSDIVAADFDGNGWLDLGVSCSATGNVFFYPNGGVGAPGVFAVVPMINGPLPNAQELVVNGQSALVLYNTGIPGIVPALGRATMVPPAAGNIGNLPADAVSIEGADLDHDLDVDLVVLQGSNLVTLYTAAGVATTTVVGTTGTPIAAAVGDLNQDGWNDVAVLTSAGIEVIYNTTYAANPPVLAAAPLPPLLGLAIATPTAIGLGDFDSDGLLDIVIVGNNLIGSQQQGYAQVFFNTPPRVGAIFATSPIPMRTWGFDVRDVEVADFDGNGRDDFAVANWGSDTVTVFLSNAIPGLVADTRVTKERCLSSAALKEDRLVVTFALYKLELRCGHYPVALASGDFDYNGKIDLAIALESADEEICAQNPSCIEIVFDVACDFHPGTGQVPPQQPHPSVPGVAGANEDQTCPVCKGEPCAENVPPKAEIQTESETKNP